MKYAFLVLYVISVILMFKSFVHLLINGEVKTTIVSLFMVFLLVPDFVILDAYGIPGTFVIVFLFVVVIPVIWLLYERKIRLHYSDLLLLALLFLLLIFAIYTKYGMGETTDYYNTKLFGYVYTVLVPVLILVCYKDTVVDAFDHWAPILLLAIIAYSFKNFSLVGIREFRELYLANYEDLKNVIFAAQTLSVGVIISLYDYLKHRRLRSIAIMFVLLLQVILFESRGPILALLVSLILMVLMYCRYNCNLHRLSSRSMIIALLTMIVMVIGIKFLWDNGFLVRVITKVSLILSGEQSEARFLIYPLTMKSIVEHFPFGIGFGNTKAELIRLNSYFGNGYPHNKYPHNIVLELFLEEGTIIAIPFVVVFCNWFKALFSNIQRKSTLVFGILYIFFFVCSMFSGDVVGNRFVFVFGILLWSTNKSVYHTETAVIDYE